MDKFLNISAEKLENLVEALDRLKQQNPLSTEVSNLDFSLSRLQVVPLKTVAKKTEAIGAEVGSQLRKQVQCECFGFEIEVSPTIQDALSIILLHAVRNSVVHGIEGSTERIQSGKSSVGKIKALLEIEDIKLNLNISDDGKGLNFNQIVMSAIRLGLINVEKAQKLTVQEKADLLFESKLTTEKDSTHLSGRGMGLSTIRDKIHDLGGSVSIDPGVSVGFHMRIQLPLDKVGLEVTEMRVGSEVFWIQTDMFEELNDASSSYCVKHSVAEILGLGVENAMGKKIIRLKKLENSPEVLSVDATGISQYRLFQKLDPIWQVTGPPWLKRWLKSTGGSAFACRHEQNSLGIAILADASTLVKLVGI